jgi:hypothetical protein
MLILLCILAFPLQNGTFSGWAMLGWNQRPLPCECRLLTSWLFAGVQKYLQNPSFCPWVYSSLFKVVRVGWCTNWCIACPQRK